MLKVFTLATVFVALASLLRAEQGARLALLCQGGIYGDTADVFGELFLINASPEDLPLDYRAHPMENVEVIVQDTDGVLLKSIRIYADVLKDFDWMGKQVHRVKSSSHYRLGVASPFVATGMQEQKGRFLVSCKYTDGRTSVTSNRVLVEVGPGPKNRKLAREWAILELESDESLVAVAAEKFRCVVRVRNTSDSHLLKWSVYGDPREQIGFEFRKKSGDPVDLGWNGNGYVTPWTVIQLPIHVLPKDSRAVGPFFPVASKESAELLKDDGFEMRSVLRLSDGVLIKSKYQAVRVK